MKNKALHSGFAVQTGIKAGDVCLYYGGGIYPTCYRGCYDDTDLVRLVPKTFDQVDISYCGGSIWG